VEKDAWQMINFTGTILRLDGIPDASGDIFDENTTIELPSREVPVTFEFHKEPEFHLGWARLYFRPGELKYDMRLDETRLPKYALDDLTPAICGSCKGRNGKKIEYASISSIGLSTSKNMDLRIKSLKDQK
jgi:hypothetical protein